MGIDAGLWIMGCQKKPDMLMVSTRGCCCSRNVKNAGSRKLPSIALLRTTLGGLPFRNRHSARPALHLLLRLHAVERLCLSSAMKPRRNSPRRYYADFYVRDEYWPDFDLQHFEHALAWFKNQDPTVLLVNPAVARKDVAYGPLL